MFNALCREISVNNLAEILSNLMTANDRFKVTFMLFALYIVLCLGGKAHISSGFLFSLKDVNCI